MADHKPVLIQNGLLPCYILCVNWKKFKHKMILRMKITYLLKGKDKVKLKVKVKEKLTGVDGDVGDLLQQ